VVDAHLAGELARRRQLLARFELAIVDRTPEPLDELLRE
jgi:hypothetical protein